MVDYSKLPWIYSKEHSTLEVAYQTPENLMAVKMQFMATPVRYVGTDWAAGSDEDRREMREIEAADLRKPHLDLTRIEVDQRLQRVSFKGKANTQKLVEWAASENVPLLETFARSGVPGAKSKLPARGEQQGAGEQLSATVQNAPEIKADTPAPRLPEQTELFAMPPTGTGFSASHRSAGPVSRVDEARSRNQRQRNRGGGDTDPAGGQKRFR